MSAVVQVHPRVLFLVNKLKLTSTKHNLVFSKASDVAWGQGAVIEGDTDTIWQEVQLAFDAKCNYFS